MYDVREQAAKSEEKNRKYGELIATVEGANGSEHARTHDTRKTDGQTRH
jgi:hypothetical protein